MNTNGKLREQGQVIVENIIIHHYSSSSKTDEQSTSTKNAFCHDSAETRSAWRVTVVTCAPARRAMTHFLSVSMGGRVINVKTRLRGARLLWISQEDVGSTEGVGYCVGYRRRDFFF